MLKVLGVMMLATLAYCQEGRYIQVASTGDLNTTQENYDDNLAMQSRANNFFCLERDTDPLVVDGEEFVRISYSGYQNTVDNVWSVFVQFPLLAYLDTNRKRALIDTILNVLNSGDTTTALNINNVCLGPYTVYEITTFQESVIIHIYQDGDPNFDASTISDRFEERVSAQLGNSLDVVTYPGQSGVIAFNLTNSMYYQEQKLHPGARSEDGADPTLLAVFLASYGRNVTIDGISESMISVNISRDAIEELNFAENPNPVNYGLEPGDIVFAVIGSLLLAIVCAATILGYCIHPFFLA